MNYLSLLIIFIVLTVLCLVLKNTREFFTEKSKTLQCLAEAEDKCTEYAKYSSLIISIIVFIYRSLSPMFINNKEVINYLINYYKLGGDKQSKITNIKNKLLEFINAGEKIDNIGTAEPVDNPFHDYVSQILEVLNENYRNVPTYIVTERNTQLPEYLEDTSLPTTPTGEKDELFIIKCALNCMRLETNEFLNQEVHEDFIKIPELTGNLEENIATILAHEFAFFPEFAGFTPTELDYNLDNKLNTFGDIIDRRKQILNNIANSLL